jgi:hypothetical protein
MKEDTELDIDQIAKDGGREAVTSAGYTPEGEPVLSWSQMVMDDVYEGFSRGDYMARCVWQIRENRERTRIQGV